MILRRNDDYPLGLRPRRRTTLSRGGWASSAGARRAGDAFRRRPPPLTLFTEPALVLRLILVMSSRRRGLRRRRGGGRARGSLSLSTSAALGSVSVEECNARVLLYIFLRRRRELTSPREHREHPPLSLLSLARHLPLARFRCLPARLAVFLRGVTVGRRDYSRLGRRISAA